MERYAKRSKYQRLNRGSHKKKKPWRVKIVKRLRWKMISPTKLWTNFKKAYIKLMLTMAGNVGHFATGFSFPAQQLPASSSGAQSFSNQQFHDRLVYEIYKNYIASRELATV